MLPSGILLEIVAAQSQRPRFLGIPKHKMTANVYWTPCLLLLSSSGKPWQLWARASKKKNLERFILYRRKNYHDWMHTLFVVNFLKCFTELWITLHKEKKLLHFFNCAILTAFNCGKLTNDDSDMDRKTLQLALEPRFISGTSRISNRSDIALTAKSDKKKNKRNVPLRIKPKRNLLKHCQFCSAAGLVQLPGGSMCSLSRVSGTEIENRNY
jgi:hypothetical protein